jgi:hypothetical protein
MYFNKNVILCKSRPHFATDSDESQKSDIFEKLRKEKKTKRKT